MAKHAFLSASSAHRWTRCEVAPYREAVLPDETNPYAEEGTKAHELLELALKSKKPASAFKDFSEDMQERVQETLDLVGQYPPENVLSECRLDISWITGEEGACGTADVIVIHGDTLIVIDLKYGRGEVDAVDNEQLLIYGAAALREFDLTGDIKHVKLIISQPKLDAAKQWELSLEELKTKIPDISAHAKRILAAKGGDQYLHATPGDKQCFFCKAKGSCPDYRASTVSIVADDFVDLDKEDELLNKVKIAEQRIVNSDDRHLAECLNAVEFIESWCKGVRQEVERRLRADTFSDPRWKLVQGRGGNRKIFDIDAVIDIAKEHGVPDDDIYEKSLLSPAQLEKKHKKTNPVFWAKVEQLIARPDGKPIMVPASDERPAVNLTLDFQNIEDEEFIEALIGMNHEEN